MALPTIETPTYNVTLPSNKQSIKFRPFLVKEEKILLTALESEDDTYIKDAVVQIFSNCIYNQSDESRCNAFLKIGDINNDME